MALVGFQGRGCADVVQPNCCHPFLLEAFLFQWPSIRRCASRTMVEHKTPEAHKCVVPLACPWISVSGLYAWSMPLLARASLNVGCSTPYAACTGYSGGRRTGLPRQTVMKSCQVRACYHGGRPEWPQCSWRARHGAAISTPSCGRLCTSPVTRSLTLSQVLLQLPYDQKLQA